MMPDNLLLDARQYQIITLQVDESLFIWLLLPPSCTIDKKCFLANFQQHGISTLYSLDQRFSAILYDTTQEQWILVTDKFSTIPLYYMIHNDTAWISHDLSLLSNKHPTTLSSQSILAYFYFHFIPSPMTCYTSIRKMLPGKTVVISKGKPIIETTNPLSSLLNRKTYKKDFIRTLHEVLLPYQRRADCGVFLSGGLDSSTLSALLAKDNPNLHAFSIFFQEKQFDERFYAKTLAKSLGIKHISCVYDASIFLQDLETLIPNLSQPFGNLSLFPCHQVAKMANHLGIKTLIAGDGGDEVFGGNSRYLSHYRLQLFCKMPKFIQMLGYHFLKISHSKKKANRFIEKIQAAFPKQLYWDAFLYQWNLEGLFEPDFLEQINLDAIETLCQQYYDEFQNMSFQHRLLQYDWRFTLADNDLVKVREACAPYSIEIIWPYLNPKIVNISKSLRNADLFNMMNLRPFFKKTISSLLPAPILKKKKHGFGMPFGLWFQDNKQLQTYGRDHLEGFKIRKIIRPDFIDSLLYESTNHPIYYGAFIWLIISLEKWLQHQKYKPIS